VGIQNRNLSKENQNENQNEKFSNSQILDRKENRAPRFRFPQGSECGIYNLPVLNRLAKGEPLYITEGCSDCWAMLSSGHKAIAIPSATLLKPKDVEQLSTLSSQLSTSFHMFPDQDEPGERLFLQLRQLLPNLEHHQLPPGCKDYSDYYRITVKG
jgi:DNA primase